MLLLTRLHAWPNTPHGSRLQMAGGESHARESARGNVEMQSTVLTVTQNVFEDF